MFKKPLWQTVWTHLGAHCLLLYLYSSVMLGNYLQQTTSADVIFQMHFSWRLRCKQENTHLFFIDMQLYNYMLYFVSGFLGGAFLTVIMYLLLIYQLDWSPYRSFCFSSFVGFLLSMFLAFSVNVRCFVLLMIPQLFSGKNINSLHPGLSPMLFVACCFFYKINFFEILFQVYHQSVK